MMAHGFDPLPPLPGPGVSGIPAWDAWARALRVDLAAARSYAAAVYAATDDSLLDLLERASERRGIGRLHRAVATVAAARVRRAERGLPAVHDGLGAQLELTVHLGKREFFDGEPIYAVLALTNKGKDTAWINMFVLTPGELDVSVRRLDGEPLSHARFWLNMLSAGDWRGSPLAPGETEYTETVLQTSWGKLREGDWALYRFDLAPASYTIVATFDPHPVRHFRPATPPFRLTTLDQREQLFAQAGADAMLVFKFGNELASTTAEDFVTELLAKRWAARDGLYVFHRDGQPLAGLRHDLLRDLVAPLLVVGSLFGVDVGALVLRQPHHVAPLEAKAERVGEPEVEPGPDLAVALIDARARVGLETARPAADEEVHVLLFEPRSTVNTGTAGGPRTRPAMQEDHGRPLRVAALLVVDFMDITDGQIAALIGFDLRVELAPCHTALVIWDCFAGFACGCGPI